MNQYSLRAKDLSIAPTSKVLPPEPVAVVQALPPAPDGNQMLTGAPAATPPATESMAEHVLRLARDAELAADALARSVLAIPDDVVEVPAAEGQTGEVAIDPTTVQTDAVVS